MATLNKMGTVRGQKTFDGCSVFGRVKVMFFDNFDIMLQRPKNRVATGFSGLFDQNPK